MSLAQVEIDYLGPLSELDIDAPTETYSQRSARVLKRGLELIGQQVWHASETVGNRARGLTRKLGRFAYNHRVGLAGLTTLVSSATAVGMAVKSSLDIGVYSTYRELFGVISDQTAATRNSSNIGTETIIGAAGAASSAVFGMGYLALDRLRNISEPQPRTDGDGGIATLFAIMEDHRDDDFRDRW